MTSEDCPWWKEAVFYQIYPRSFNDSDGDGIGDINGIVEKIDYLDWLGVDCVWLNPVYLSPGKDQGYDIADYRSINPEYGDMSDWENLLSELHERDIGLVMDLVLNHTSTQHEWFRKSRRGDPEYEDYYYWRSTDDRSTRPNNWESFFDTPAWSFDEVREAFYLTLFSEAQADLNWDNSEVRSDLFEIVNWWLSRGIDGFRLDVINLISKSDGLPDGTPGKSFLTGGEHFINGPEMHRYFEELYRETLAEHPRELVALGECVDIDPKLAEAMTGTESNLLDMVIFFDHMLLDRDDRWGKREWELQELKKVMRKWQDAVEDGTWVSLFLSNHDQPRQVSRFGNDVEYRYESATMLATWLHGHKGTPFVYQGEEIGMGNVSFESPDEIRDVWAKNYWENARSKGKEFDEVREDLERFSRDNARTPMQWNDKEFSGFSEASPWIKIAESYETVNVADQRARETSILRYYKELISLRDREPLLVEGDFEMLVPAHNSIYAFARTSEAENEELIIACNFTDDSVTSEIAPRIADSEYNVLLANLGRDTLSEVMQFQPYEAVIAKSQSHPT